MKTYYLNEELFNDLLVKAGLPFNQIYRSKIICLYIFPEAHLEIIMFGFFSPAICTYF